MASPRFDIVVFGATSFVGRLLCEYLLAHYGADGARGLRWAMAGRSAAKLQALVVELGAAAAPLQLITADAADEAALRVMCAQARVVVSTVGPYALYGEPLVKVCAETGTDYCDLTGETPWIRQMLDRYEKQAQRSGARIVHCCGFDSIPSDLGVWFLQQQAQKQFGRICPNVKMRVKAMRGAASGGTVASLMNVVKEAARDPALRKMLADPYLLCTDGQRRSHRQVMVKAMTYDDDLHAWAAPFIMAAINTRVVQRSNALLGNAWGERFLYDEAMLTGAGVAGRMAALGVTAGLGVFTVATALKPSRWFLERFVLPAPGDGPDARARERGFFDLRFVGFTERDERIDVKVTGDRDPGYGSTAKMLGQAAACLALDTPHARKAGGFWTPASAFGELLVSRLTAHAGLGFEVIEAPKA